MWFWETRKEQPVARRSIGEKIRYYKRMLNDSNPKKREKARKNLEHLNNYTTTKTAFGEVFMVKDNLFNPTANNLKSRRIVCVEVKRKK